MIDTDLLTTINPSSPIPKYHQIKLTLRQLYEDEILQPGGLLPSEYELADHYGVSRLTVRQAIGDLVAEGLLVRKQGVGTFVAEPKPVQIQPSPMGFSARMFIEGLVPSSQLVSVEQRRATRGLAKKLDIPEGEKIIEIVRVRFANDEPVMLETSRISSELIPDIKRHDLSNSLYQVLEEQYDIHVSQGEQYLEPILLTEYNADLLHAQPGTPALLIETVAWDRSGKPVETTIGILRGDKSRYYFRIQTGVPG